MFSIESAMLVALGFSAAGLIACVFAPVYRRRAARLATETLKRAMPLTEAEIAADKDRIRAEYAIRIHKLESGLSDASLESARQLVEINRRDARISALESDVARLGTINEEHENARRVLEMTIMERLPKVESRLAEAKKLLFERDREISFLTQSAQKQAQALAEATQINTQQRDDIHRLNATLSTRAARLRDLPSDQRHEAEIALRTELEALRARLRDQAQLIARPQAGEEDAKGAPATTDAGAEMARLRASLAEAEQALQSARGEAAAERTPNEANETEVRALKAALQDQTAEIARLKAALATWETAGGGAESAGDSAVALKARIESLEAQTTEQMSTILGLRAEVAAGNDKLARQATFYMDEMRRLGAGTRPTAGSTPSSTAPAANPARPSLSERISAPRVATVEISPAADAGGPDSARNGHHASAPAAEVTPSASPSPKSESPADKPAAPARRQSLLQRITGLEKPVA